jgi:alpha/beta superfamily hydrolase
MFRSVAALEYSYGANILLFDYRGHGESMLKPTTCGNAEVHDLVAALNLVASQAETASGQVYIHGFSLGAAVALLLPPHPAVAGVIADSAYARLDDMIRVLILQILDQQTSGWRGRCVLFFPSSRS